MFYMPQNWHFKSQFPPRKISRSNWLAPGKIRSLCSLLTSGLCQLISLLYYSPEEPQSSSWLIVTTSYQTLRLYLMCLHVTSSKQIFHLSRCKSASSLCWWELKRKWCLINSCISDTKNWFAAIISRKAAMISPSYWPSPRKSGHYSRNTWFYNG